VRHANLAVLCTQHACIQAGPAFARLKNGETVTVPLTGGGTATVEPAQVVGPCVPSQVPRAQQAVACLEPWRTRRQRSTALCGLPAQVFAIVDCPAAEFLPSLVSQTKLDRYRHANAADAPIHLMVPRHSALLLLLLDALSLNTGACQVHIGDAAVVASDAYTEWALSFGPATEVR
jgi:hypothetical protein